LFQSENLEQLMIFHADQIFRLVKGRAGPILQLHENGVVVKVNRRDVLVSDDARMDEKIRENRERNSIQKTPEQRYAARLARRLRRVVMTNPNNWHVRGDDAVDLEKKHLTYLVARDLKRAFPQRTPSGPLRLQA